MTDGEFDRLKLDAAILSGEVVLQKAISENRALSSTEDALVRLAEMDRDSLWRQSIAQRKAAGGRVLFWEDARFYPRKQCEVRLENSSESPSKIFIYGDIEHDVTAKEFTQSLALVPDGAEVQVHVFSYGGSYHEALAVHNSIRSRRGKTHGVCDAVAASGGSVILQGCSTVSMCRGSYLMLHGVQFNLSGPHSAEELRESAARADRLNETLFQIYRERWSGSDQSLLQALKEDTWLDENESVRSGLADRVIDVPAVARQVPTNIKFQNTPATLTLGVAAIADRVQLRRRLAGLRLHQICVR